jgi:hypothetical protein
VQVQAFSRLWLTIQASQRSSHSSTKTNSTDHKTFSTNPIQIETTNPVSIEHSFKIRKCPVSDGLLLSLLHLFAQQPANTFVASSSSPKDKGSDDDVTMDAPDSPPEFTQAQASTWQSSKEAAQPTPQANTGSRVNGEAKAHFGAPGSSWQTKKFSEEYERAEANLLDKQWSHSRLLYPLGEEYY